jgi:hypothetical protein
MSQNSSNFETDSSLAERYCRAALRGIFRESNCVRESDGRPTILPQILA